MLAPPRQVGRGVPLVIPPTSLDGSCSSSEDIAGRVNRQGWLTKYCLPLVAVAAIVAIFLQVTEGSALWNKLTGKQATTMMIGDGIPLSLGDTDLNEENEFIIWFSERYMKEHTLQEACKDLPGNPDVMTGSTGLPACILRTTGAKIKTFFSKHNLHFDGNKGIILIEADAEVPQGLDIPVPDSTKSWTGSSYRWNLDRIDDVEPVYDKTYATPNPQGQGVHIYILDTGIRTTHADFEGRAIPTLETYQGRVRECMPTDLECAKDLNGHGTHVAGIAAGKISGVAKQATIHAVKAGDDKGSFKLSWAVKAIDWIVSKGQRPAIISMSMNSKPTSEYLHFSLDTAVQDAYHAGVPVVVSAGNWQEDGGGNDACKNTPGREESAVTVAYSSQGDRRGVYSNYGSCVDFFAPGECIVSASHLDDTSYVVKTGTSQAAPLTAGVGAVGLSLGITPQTLKSWLVSQSVKDKIADTRGTPNRLLHMSS